MSSFHGLWAGVGVWLAAGGVLTGEGYNEWVARCFPAARAAAGEAALAADSDGDGALNLLEYVIGGTPCVGDGGPRWLLDPAGGCGEVGVVAGCRDAEVEVESSADMVVWEAVDASVGGDGRICWEMPVGRPFVRLKVAVAEGAVIDSDGDGLHDAFEEALAARNPNDAFRGLADIRPGDDFDGDGTSNLLDPANHATGPRCNAGPSLIDPSLVAAVVDARVVPGPAAFAVHTPLD